MIEVNQQMMYVDVARCTGCGACVEACPAGAIQVIEDERGRYAQIDVETCRMCEACLASCPEEAIMVQLEGELVSPEETMPAVAPSRAVQLAWPVPKAVIWAGAVLALAGRQILPRVADLLVDVVARRASQPSTPVSDLQPRSDRLPSLSAGRQHRHRQRRRRA